MTVDGRKLQRAVSALPVDCVWIGAAAQQQLDNVQVPPPTGLNQRQVPVLMSRSVGVRRAGLFLDGV